MSNKKNKIIYILSVLLLLCGAEIFLAGMNRAEAQEHYDYIVTDEEFGADGTDEGSDAKEIQSALAKAIGAKEQVTIYFPAGIYYIDKPLRVYSNTHLVLDDNAVICRMDSLIDRGFFTMLTRMAI